MTNKVMNRIEEVKRIYSKNARAGRVEMLALLKRYGKRRDNIGMTVRVAAYHMGVG